MRGPVKLIYEETGEEVMFDPPHWKRGQPSREIGAVQKYGPDEPDWERSLPGYRVTPALGAWYARKR